MANGFYSPNATKVSRDLNAFIRDTSDDIQGVVDVVVNEISTDAQNKSPVRTGLFKSLWAVEVDGALKKNIINTAAYAAILAMGGRGTQIGSKQVQAGWIDTIINRALDKVSKK